MWLVGTRLRRSWRRGTPNTGAATPDMRQSQVFTESHLDKPSMDLLATEFWDGTYILWASQKVPCEGNVNRKRNPSPCLALARHGTEIFGSAWLVTANITMVFVLALALWSSPNNIRGIQWNEERSDCKLSPPPKSISTPVQLTLFDI